MEEGTDEETYAVHGEQRKESGPAAQIRAVVCVPSGLHTTWLFKIEYTPDLPPLSIRHNYRHPRTTLVKAAGDMLFLFFFFLFLWLKESPTAR